LLASRQFFGSETKKIKLVLFGIVSPVSRSLPILQPISLPQNPKLPMQRHR
jgi:hypothetical protein